ncbi:hypothetical protein QBC34DRAFT_418587 [Podospora aff. communis PSN243]|uniref:Uncharacterized protein n=1 Tax=Podospora aff. communis PSN243 TaxID=3040156 RepID=A0AAV9FYB3_9PEZI|nr:hypothetical protein QBC34DRAFT_418587 [Podospora aff. communis PSN243]
MFRALPRISRTKPSLSTPAKCLRARVTPGARRRITTSKKAEVLGPNPPAPSPKSNPPGGHKCNPLEDPANDLGGPGGQELYPPSMAFQKRYASITAAGVMISGAIMYLAKKMTWGPGYDPDVRHVLVRDMSKGEIDDVKMIPVRVSAGTGNLKS